MYTLSPSSKIFSEDQILLSSEDSNVSNWLIYKSVNFKDTSLLTESLNGLTDSLCYLLKIALCPVMWVLILKTPVYTKMRLLLTKSI